LVIVTPRILHDPPETLAKGQKKLVLQLLSNLNEDQRVNIAKASKQLGFKETTGRTLFERIRRKIKKPPNPS